MRNLLIFLALVTLGGCGTAAPNLGDAGPDAAPAPADGLAFVPTGKTFTEPFSLELVFDESASEVWYTVDDSLPDAAAGVGQKYSGPIAVEQTTWVRAQLKRSDGTVTAVQSEVYIRLDAEAATFDSNLPLVVIDSFGFDVDDEWDSEEGRPYRPVKAVFIDTGDDGRARLDGPPDWAGYGGMHVRGSSTSEYAKKQYKLETREEDDSDLAASILGFPKESDWILHAPYSDKTLMRNHLIYGWSRSIGRYAARAKFVELFVAATDQPVTLDDYRGVYVFMEKIKRDPERVNIAKLTSDIDSEPEISGGYLLVKDWEEEGEEDIPYDLTTDHYQDRINYAYPRAEKITAAQRAWIKGYLDEFEAALSGPGFTGADGYAAYADVGSFVDHMLLVELGRTVDGYVLSTYLFKDRGGKLNMGPIWDYNGALGNADYFEAWETSGWHYNFDGFPEDNPTAFRWYERMLEDPAFVAARAARWQELRQGPLATSVLMEAIDANAALLAEAQARNFERWPVLGEHVWPNDEGAEDRHTYAEEVAYLKQWVTGRAEWLDSAMP